MKITKRQLRRIIKEEKQKLLCEIGERAIIDSPGVSSAKVDLVNAVVAEILPGGVHTASDAFWKKWSMEQAFIEEAMDTAINELEETVRSWEEMPTIQESLIREAPGYKDITIVAGPTLEDAAYGFSASMYFDSPGEEMRIPLKGGKLIATLNSDGVITVDIIGGDR